MDTTTTQINHLIKTLAEQLRHAESFNGMWGKTKERTEACAAASKTVAQLEGLGVHHEDSFSKAESLNEAMAA
jgi:hypothetical protein